MYFPLFRLPVPKVDETDPGSVVVAATAVANTPLDHGYYLIAAESQPLKWKLGATDVTLTTGSFLAAGDQVLIYVPTDALDFSFMRTALATGDGNLAINKAVFMEIDTQDPAQ